MMIEKVQRITAPAVEPVSLSEAKEQLRIEDSFTLEDSLIQAYVSAARDHAEKYCNRSWALATFFATFSGFRGVDEPLLMADPGIVSIDGISYVDAQGSVQTITAYTFDADRQEIRPDGNWPTDATRIKVEYTAGADASASPPEYVPEAVKVAILMLAADMYEIRTAQLTQSINENRAVAALLNPYRVEMGV